VRGVEQSELAVAPGRASLGKRFQVGDSFKLLKELPDGSVHCVVTSPPYWGLRDYGVEGQYGLEPTLPEYIERMAIFFDEVYRVLRKDGTLWLNLGDCYSKDSPSGDTRSGFNRRWHDKKYATDKQAETARRNKTPRLQSGLPAKNLCGVPWRVAFALQERGWLLRSSIVWHKPNPVPESVRDRPTLAHEMVFLFTRSPRYFYDDIAAREPTSDPSREDTTKTRKIRNVWSMVSDRIKEKHYATFPRELAQRCIEVGTSTHGVCSQCGSPWRRQAQRPKSGDVRITSRDQDLVEGARMNMPNGWPAPETQGWQPSCICTDNRPVPATVLDPFMGSGTTAIVSEMLDRDWLGFDIDERNVEIWRARRSALLGKS
jgi:DNA modification methylase